MESLATQALYGVYANMDLFLVIVARLLGFFVILPILSGGNIPATSRAGLAVVLAYIVLVSGKVTEVSYYNSVLGFAILIGQEFIVGFFLAYIVYMVFTVMYFVGQLIDYQIGFSMVSVLDPTTQIQVPIVGNLLYLLMGAMLIVTGGLQALLAGLFYSYDKLPIGTARIISNGELLTNIISLIVSYFIIGVQIALPVVGTILIVDIALGLLVKAVPQMNIFVVGMPLKLLIGLIIFYLITPVFYDVYNMLFDKAYTYMFKVMEGMMAK